MSEEAPPTDLTTTDSVTLSLNTTPLRDEPVITQMEAEAIESELNELTNMDQYRSPHSEATALSLDTDSQVTEAPADPQGARLVQ